MIVKDGHERSYSTRSQFWLCKLFEIKGPTFSKLNTKSNWMLMQITFSLEWGTTKTGPPEWDLGTFIHSGTRVPLEWSRLSGPTFGGPGSPSSGPVLVVLLLAVPGVPRQVVPFGWSCSRVPDSRDPLLRYSLRNVWLIFVIYSYVTLGWR